LEVEYVGCGEPLFYDGVFDDRVTELAKLKHRNLLIVNLENFDNLLDFVWSQRIHLKEYI